jgi:1,4-alpha-glucan branching enzyme
VLYKYDPYAYYSEVRPKTASIVYDLEGYSWEDTVWQEKKKDKLSTDQSMLIYECISDPGKGKRMINF